MKLKTTFVLALIILAASTGFARDKILNIVIRGNETIARNTILFYMKSQKGGAFSEKTIREDFRLLWETGFFENIEITADHSPAGTVLNVNVTENPLLSSITYNTGRKIKENDIKEKLQEENIILTSMSYVDPVKLKKAKNVIRDLLLEKGFYSGKVEMLETPAENDAIDLVVNVEEGPKTLVGRVVFEGLEGSGISPGYLKRGVKNNKPHNLVNTILSKDVYKPEKISEDLEEIKSRFQKRGYIEAKVGTPRISMVNRIKLFGARPQKMARIVIPVTPGPQYTFAGFSVSGNEVVQTDFLRTFVQLKKGKVYDVAERDENIQEMQKFYQGLGYLACQISPKEDLDPETRKVRLNLRIHEGEIVYLRRLSFHGNTYTKDRVLRRVFFLREGGRLRATLLEDSVRRMKQLGLVDIQDPPFEFSPVSNESQKMDLKVFVKEMHRTMVNFNFGYSGYNGLFIALGYSTKNFLGVGEQLAINLSHGQNMKNYQLSFTEPRLFHLPANAGFSLFKQDMDYVGFYKRKTAGFSLNTSFRFLKYFGGRLAYRFSRIDEDEIMEMVNPYFYFSGTMSALSPTVYYNTVDSPLFPTSGMKIQLDYRYSGGFLGGDVDMHKTTFKFIKFFPLQKKRTFGMQFLYQNIEPFGKGIIPRTEKVYFGGEQSIRGFRPYTIGPRDIFGYTQGGMKGFHMNFELHIPLNEQLTMIGFYDLGNAYGLDEQISFNNLYQSAGLEVRVMIPMLGVPFRLIFAYNPRVLDTEDNHFVFRFGVGPSFN